MSGKKQAAATSFFKDVKTTGISNIPKAKYNRSGKKQAAATSFFKDVKTTGISNIPKVKCSFCGTVITKSSYRLKKHIEGCLECTDNFQITYLSKKHPRDKVFPTKTGVPKNTSPAPKNQDEASRPPATRFANFNPSITPATQLAFRDVQSSIMSRVDRTTEEENAQMTLLLARAIFASAAPLNLVENSYWKKLFASLRPTFRPPNHQKVSNDLLEQVFEETSSKVRETVAAASSVALLSGGWKNTNDEAVIKFHVTVPEPVFWSSLPTRSSDHSAEYVAGQIQKVIEEVGSQKVLGLCTDYAMNMKQAWELLKQRYPQVHPYGCLVHSLNIIFIDVCKVKSLAEMIADSEVIVRSVNNSPEIIALFKQHQQQLINKQQKAEKCVTNLRSQQTLKLPVNTWWGSSVLCLESLQNNKQALQTLAASTDFKDQMDISIIRMLLSEIFWAKLSVYLSFLKPVVDVIKRVEGERQQCLSIVIEVFHEINERFQENIYQSLILHSDDKNQMKSIIANGKNIAVNRIHMSANLLDPNYTGRHLTNQEIIDAFQIIQEIASEVQDVSEGRIFGELADYRSKQTIFQKPYIWEAVEHTSPFSWWTGLCGTTELSKIAARILKLPPTCTAAVKTVSKLSRFNSSHKKNGTSSKADKLLFVARNLCLTENECGDKEVGTLAKPETAVAPQAPAAAVQEASLSGAWTPRHDPVFEDEFADISPIEWDPDNDSEGDL